MKTYEEQIAELESIRNYTSEQYFNARKELWSKRKEKIFNDGFERGYNAYKNRLEEISTACVDNYIKE